MKKGKNVPAETTPEHERVSPSVPPAMLQENKPTTAHNRSHAAHLEPRHQEAHSKPAGDLRRGSYPTGRKQP
ncbi:hypothetical protein DYQ86_27020 [Acidobacteria bacterium AB60]|nr:hypothetical protein DYQ86_27020 [Acidobacteria bacterium AB60]